MSNFTINCPSWWNSHSNENQYLNPPNRDMSFEMGSLIPNCHNDIIQDTYLGFQQQQLEKPSPQLCASMNGGWHMNPEVQGLSLGQNLEGPAVNFMNYPDFLSNPPKVDPVHSMGCMPYPLVADPYFNALYNPYGQPQVTPQMMAAAGRVPLPSEFGDDSGPIYVNARQYHGILRRRQVRARLESQNKLVKSRKRYLHESRHLHALNRARGTGGRFVSARRDEEADDPMMADANNGMAENAEAEQFHPPSSDTMMASTSAAGGGGDDVDDDGLMMV